MKKIFGSVGAVAVLMGASFAFAVEVTWEGNSDADFGTGANWSPSPFTDGDSMLFGLAGTSGATLNNDLAADIDVAGITFTAGADAYSLGGNRITLGGNIGFSGDPAAAITQTINLAMALSATRVVTTTANGNITLGGIISGATFGLTKNGEGTLTLQGANTFSGVLTLNAGTLRTETDNTTALGAGTLVLNGGTLSLASSANRSYNRNTTINGNVTLMADNLVSTDVARTMTLGTLVLNGDILLRTERGANITGAFNGQINFGATTLYGNLVVSQGTRSYVLFAALSESGGSYSLTVGDGVTANGGTSGVLLNGAGSWTGGTVIHSGYLRAAVANSLGVSGGLTTVHGGTLDLRNATAADNRDITFTGTGALQLTQNADTTWNIGNFTHLGGTLTIQAQRSGDGGNTLHTWTNALQLNGNLVINTVKRASGDFVTLSFQGAITDTTGAAELRKTGGGILVLDTAAGHGGDTRISDGILRLGAAQVLPSGAAAGNLVMDPATGITATLDLNGFDQTLNGVSNSGDGAGVIDNAGDTAATLTVGANDASSAFSGVIQNSGLGNLSLVKTGAGTIELAGANTYAGGTTISGGTLSFLAKAAKPGAGTVTVDAGATVALGTHASDVAYWSSGELDDLWFDGMFGTFSLDANSKIGIDTSAADFTYATAQTDYTLVKLGANALTLTGDSDFTGGVEIRGGVLALGDGGTTGTLGLGNVVNDTSLVVNRSNDIELSGAISGAGALTKLGVGALTLSGANTYTGLTTVHAGTLKYGAANAIPGDVIVNANAAGVTALLDLNDFDGTLGALTFGGTGATDTSIHQVTTGLGTLTLGGDVTFDATGNPTTGASIAGNLNLGAATRTFAIGDSTGAAVDLAVGAVISGSGVGLTKTGAGTLELSGENTFTGPVTLNEGTLRAAVDSIDALGTGAATLVLNGGILHLASDVNQNYSRDTTIGGNTTIVVDNLTALDAARTLTLGTLNIVGDVSLRTERGDLVAGGVNRNGQINFGAATLQGNLTVSQATRTYIQLSGLSESGGSYSLTVGDGIVANGGTSGVLLNGVGSWTGGTVVNSGLLRAAVANSLGTSGGLTTVNAGTVDLRNTNSAVDRDILFAGTGTLALSANVVAGTTFHIGTLTQTAGTLTITAQRTGDSVTHVTQILNEDIELNGSLTFNTVKHTSGGLNTLRFQGAITHASGTGEVRKNGGGILILEAPATYGGNTRISDGTLLMGVAAALPTGAGTGNLVMDPGTGLTATLDLNGFDHTVNGISSSGAGTSVIDNTGAGAVTLTVGDNDGGGIFGGNIQDTDGALALVKTGTGAISLSGQNTYAGGTTIDGGVLSFVNTGALSPNGTVTAGAAGAVGLGAHATDDVNYWLAGDIDTLWNDGVLGDISIHADSRVGIDTTAGDFTYAGAWATRGLIKLGNNTLILTGDNTYTGGTDILAGILQIGDGGGTGSIGTGNVLNNANITINRSNAYEIADNISGSGSLTQIGPGVTTLSGDNTYTGNTTVSGGTLNVTGTITGNTTSSFFYYGGTSTANSIANVSNDMTLFGLRGSNVDGGVGVYNQTAGTVDVTGDGGSATYIAGAAGSYGYFNLTGGTFKERGRFGFGINSNLATPSISVAYIGGSGRLDQTDGLWMLNYSHAQITVAGNGEIDRTGAINPFGLIMNSTTAGGLYGELNVAGGSFRTGTQPIRFGNSTTAGAGNDNTALINLAGGTLEVGTAMTTSFPSAGANNAYLNFAGGTLKTTAGIINWIPTSPSGITFTSNIYGPIDNSDLAGAPSFDGGLVFDSNGFNSSIGTVLGGATADGVAQSSLTVTGGSGYVGAPEVIFTGGTLAAGGSPAAGYALINGGEVTGIVITSPGSYSDATGLQVALTGGGGTGASVAVGSLAANTSGGLTKNGAGILTLTGANTFTGLTTVNGGSLSVSPGAVANTSGLVVGATGNASFDLFADLDGVAWAPAADASITLGSATT